MSQSTTKRMSPKMASPSEARASTAIPRGRGGPGRSRRRSGARRGRGRPERGGAAVAAGSGAAPEAPLLLRTGLRAAAAGAPRAAAAFLSAQEAGRAGTSVTGPAPCPPRRLTLGPSPSGGRGRCGAAAADKGRVCPTRPLRPPGSGVGAAEALAPCRPSLAVAA